VIKFLLRPIWPLRRAPIAAIRPGQVRLRREVLPNNQAVPEVENVFDEERRVVEALALMAVSVASAARADLTPWKDYQVSDAVWQVTTVKVDAGMGDAYLEGLKKTWLTSMETQKKLGNIEDYKIFRSDLFMSGEFNMMLVVKFKNTADMAPNKAKYEAFMKEWGEARQKEAKDLSQKTYPTLRKITGQYDFREVTLK
jgi:hypothetical protein